MRRRTSWPGSGDPHTLRPKATPAPPAAITLLATATTASSSSIFGPPRATTGTGQPATTSRRYAQMTDTLSDRASMLAAFDESTGPVSASRSLPPELYTSTQIWEFEREALFGNDCLCRSDEHKSELQSLMHISY